MSLLSDFDVFFVVLQCPLAELEQRFTKLSTSKQRRRKPAREGGKAAARSK